MIRFVPVTNENLGEPYSDDALAFGYIGYNLSDNEKKCGQCVFHINGYSVDINYVEVYDSDKETAEGLIRSALNYGANRNAYIGYYKADNYIDVAKGLGFVEKNGALSGEIPELLAGSCCKRK